MGVVQSWEWCNHGSGAAMGVVQPWEWCNHDSRVAMAAALFVWSMVGKNCCWVHGGYVWGGPRALQMESKWAMFKDPNYSSLYRYLPLGLDTIYARL